MSATKALDWAGLKPQIDIMHLAAHLLGPAASKRGSKGTWLCPFHDDHNPSLDVDAKYQRFRCWSCGEHGDAMALLMGVQRLTFLEGLEWFRKHLGVALTTSPARAPKPRVECPSGPRGISRADAERLVSEAVGGLDGLEAKEARDDLARRGITRRTAERFRIGFSEKIRYLTRDGQWGITQGLVIPWYESGRLVRVKVRKTGLFRGTRYLEIFSEGARVYPDPAVVWPGQPLVVTEGELDAVLVTQTLLGLARVVTLGGTSAKPDEAIRQLIGQASAVFLALDADDAGRRAMDDWGIESKRLTPPPGASDWCACQEAGFPIGIDLTWWLMGQIGATPGAFAGERQPEPLPREDDGPADNYDAEERAAILEYDGGLSREEAERRAGPR